jgi:putative ABC transport system permease protein
MTLDGLRLVAFGLLIGSLGGIGLTRFITFALYGVSPLDVTTWIASLLLMFVAGLAATLVPAHRATRVNPVIAIQAE